VLIDPMNLHYCLGRVLEDILDLAADGGSGQVLGPNEARRREETQREGQSGDGREVKPEKKFRRATKI